MYLNILFYVVNYYIICTLQHTVGTHHTRMSRDRTAAASLYYYVLNAARRFDDLRSNFVHFQLAQSYNNKRRNYIQFVTCVYARPCFAVGIVASVRSSVTYNIILYARARPKLLVRSNIILLSRPQLSGGHIICITQ